MCNRNIVRCRGVHSCCHKVLLEILDFIVEQLNEKNITYWLTFGTLLGAVRNNKMIPWDEDIDIGILVMDMPAALELSRVFQQAGFGWNVGVRQGGSEVGKINVYASMANSLHADISIYRTKREGDVSYAEGVLWPLCRTHLDNIKPENLIDIELEGKTYKAPRNPEELLENFYGDDWQKPKVKRWIKERALKDADASTIEAIRAAGEYIWEPGRGLKG